MLFHPTRQQISSIAQRASALAIVLLVMQVSLATRAFAASLAAIPRPGSAVAGASIAAPAPGDSIGRHAALAAVIDTGAVARLRANFTPANRRYARVRQALALFEPFWDFGFALLLLASGVSVRFRDLARRAFRRRYGRLLVYAALAGVASFVWHLPLDAFRDYWWEHRFGLSNQTLAAWAIEQLKSLGLGYCFLAGSGLLALALWGIETAGRRWWLWIACGTLPVAIAAVLLQPLVFEPAFNQFKPLGDATLDRGILALGARAGIPAKHVFEVDRSRQTRTVNAYVCGFGPSQRIVIWDTTLERLSHDEILFVMGHEMGHYKLGHLWQGVALVWFASFTLLFVAARLFDSLLARHGSRWGIHSLADEAALPLIALVLGALLTLLQPAANAWSRKIEHEADVYGLEATRFNAAAASTFVKFGEENRSDPDPPLGIKLLLYTHPPLVERVRFALNYRPWQTGRADRYYTGPPPPAN